MLSNKFMYIINNSLRCAFDTFWKIIKLMISRNKTVIKYVFVLMNILILKLLRSISLKLQEYANVLSYSMHSILYNFRAIKTS